MKKRDNCGCIAAVSATLLLLCCASAGTGRLQTTNPKFGDTESANYEYANRSIVDDAREAHYLVNIEIDEPYAAELRFPEMLPVYTASPVEGSVIVRISTDAKGKVSSYTFVKRGGLGLDEYVDTLMRNAVFKPVMRKGEFCSSEFTARFVFGGRR